MSNIQFSRAEKTWIRSNGATMKDKEGHPLFNSTFRRNISFAAYRKLRQRCGVRKRKGRPSRTEKSDEDRSAYT